MRQKPKELYSEGCEEDETIDVLDTATFGGKAYVESGVMLDPVYYIVFGILLTTWAMAEWKQDAAYYFLSASISFFLGVELTFHQGYSHWIFAIFIAVWLYHFILFIARLFEYLDMPLPIGGR